MGFYNTACDVISVLQVLGSTIQIPEEKFLQALNEMSPGADSLHSTVGGENVLHFTAAKGYTDLAKQILDRDCTDLLWQENRSCMYPIQTAEKGERFSTAEVLLRSANDRFRKTILAFHTLAIPHNIHNTSNKNIKMCRDSRMSEIGKQNRS